MGIVHRMKDESEHSRRCPYCKHLSTVSTQDGEFVYFYCQNPKCSVERIYSDDSVMISGGVLKGDERL